jgi:Ku70/Ku80 beta-barrel domain
MAPRANWKGFLRLSLVTCPVALYPATSESEKISFNQLNRKTGHRIKYAKVDADTGEELANEDIVRATRSTPTPSSRSPRKSSRTSRWNRPGPSRSTSSSTAPKSTHDTLSAPITFVRTARSATTPSRSARPSAKWTRSRSAAWY